MLEGKSLLVSVWGASFPPTHHQHRVDTLDLRELRIKGYITAVAQDAIEALQSQWRQIIGQPQQGEAYGVSLPLDQLRIGAIRRRRRRRLMPLMMSIRIA